MDEGEEGEQEEEKDAEVEKAIENLVIKLNENPKDFSAYQELITLYREAGKLEELALARERVHYYYCLPVDMWLDWIEDEERLYALMKESEDE